MSTLIEFLYNGSNIAAATPGLSFTPSRLTFALFLVKDTPLIIFVSLIFFLPIICVPDLFAKDDWRPELKQAA